MEIKCRSNIWVFVFAILGMFSQNLKANGKWDVHLISDSLVENADIVTRYQADFLDVISKEKSKLTSTKIYSVLRKDTHWEEIQLYYSKFRKISEVTVIVYDARGEKIKTYNKKDFKDRTVFDNETLQSDSRYLYLETSQNEYPYTIELIYETMFTSNFLLPDFNVQLPGESIEYEQVKIRYPRELKLNLKTQQIDEQDFVHTAESSETHEILQWLFMQKKAFVALPMSLPWHEVIPVIKCSPTYFILGGVEGNLQSWENFGKFLYELNKDQSKPSAEIKALVANLTAGLTSDMEKIESIYAHVKENMRYVSVQLGVGGWQAFDADYVHKNKFGDCKALCNYTKTLLSEAGIKSILAVTFRGDEKNVKMDEGFVENVFNHMILYVPEHDLFLECTARNYPTGYVGSDNISRKCLLADSEWSGLKIVKNKDQFSDLTQIEVSVDLTSTPFKVNYVNKTFGANQEYWRYCADNLTLPDMEKTVLRQFDLPPVQLENLQVKYEPQKAEATLSADFQLLQIGNSAGNRWFVNVNAIDKFLLPMDKINKTRTGDFYQESEGNYEITIKIKVPEEFQVENGLVSETRESPFGKYDIKSSFADGQLTYERKLKMMKGRHSGEAYPDFYAFAREYNKLENGKIVFKKP